MKGLIFLGVVSLFYYVQCAAMTSDVMMKKFMERAMECKAKEGVSDDDFNNLIAKNPPNSHEAKCLMACLAEQDGVVSRHEPFFQEFLIIFGIFTS